MAKFVHLHVHTEYSLLDGLSRISNLFKHVKDSGMDAIAMTDHGAMYGAIEFTKKAQAAGIKSIVGMEGYTCLEDHTIRPEKGRSQNYHILLLAKNDEGYRNLMKITSIAHTEGYYYRPRVSREILAKYSKGLICTSSCPLGEIGQAIIDDDYKKAKGIAKWFYDVFKDDYYLEIQRHKNEEYAPLIKDPEIKAEIIKMGENEKKINENVIKLSREMGIPLIATNDAHYIKKDDATAQDALVCIATGKNVSDTKRLRFIDVPNFYITTPDEMEALFPDVPDAIKNSVKIAEKCDLTIQLGKWFFPNFALPDNLTADEYLKKLTLERLPEMIAEITPEIKERIEYELGIIIQKGYAPYFLIVMDMVNWANETGIVTNTRGSAAGSLVSFVLGITTVNPIKYYLPFERFLNPYRPSPPDIDFDVSDNRREEVIAYISSKYGKDKVAQICTFGRMLARASVRDVARVLGYPYAVGDKIAKLIPPPKQGFPIDIPKALDETPDLKDMYDTDKDVKIVLDLAHIIEGNARHISVHAAGVVVSPTTLTDFTPIQKEPSGDKVITQYEMHACEDVGLIKFDILGIRNLSILGSAVDIVQKTRGVKVDIRKIPLDDKKTFQMLGRGETMGVFQLSGSGMTKYLTELKPTRVEDLMAMVALYRPGPIAVIPEYIQRKRNPKLVKYLDPRMEKFLGASYGLIVYQDDLLFCALDLAGYTWEEADKFRKAVGKKIPEEMAAQKEKFIKGIITKGQTQEFAESLWKLFEPFQSYGFNKAHAASYGMVAYQTGYMKANYPVEYMCALMTAESNDTEKVTQAINECKRIKIKVLPPDINCSLTGFEIENDKESLEGKAIRFGLNAIKNVGDAAIEAILAARADADFKNFSDFLIRVDGRKVNKKVIESLIKVGALSRFGKRSSLLSSMDELRSKLVKPKTNNENQQGLFDLGEIDKTKIVAETQEFLAMTEEFTDEQIEDLERELLGFSLSAPPITDVLLKISPFATHKIHDIGGEFELKNDIKIACVIKEVRVIVTKTRGEQMAFVKVEDETGTVDMVVFPRIFEKSKALLQVNSPILVTGKVDYRDQGVSLIVNEMSSGSVDTNDEAKVYIKIPKNTSKDKLTLLKQLLDANPGSHVATLVFEGNEYQKIDLKDPINWNNSLAHNISSILDINPPS